VIRPARFIIAFFISIAFSISVQAQTDSTAFFNQKSKTGLFYVQKQTEYIHFNSDSIFQVALKNKKLSAVYSIVSIVDTVIGIPRKKTAVVHANKIRIPFDYDSILYTTADEFICKKHLVTKRSYSCSFVIVHATNNQQIDYKAKSIQYVGNHLYLIRTAKQLFFYNSKTQQASASFDSYTVYDSIYLITQTASTYQLLDLSANSLTTTVFKTIQKKCDTSYTITPYYTWDMYKNTNRTIYLTVACDSIKPSTEIGKWNVYRNDAIYYRRNLDCTSPTPVAFKLNKNVSDSINISKLKYDTIKTILRFDTVYYQSDNLLMYKKGDGYGYCDTIGNVKISHQYDTITAWHNNVAAIRMKKKWGYVNKREQMIVQPYYTYALPFANNAAPVFDGKRWMFITKEGKNINSITFDSIKQTVSGKWYIYNKGLMGLCDVDGRELIPPMYTYLLDSHSDLYVFQHESLYGLIARDRSIIHKPSYDYFTYDTINQYYLFRRPATTEISIIRHTQY
jgi:hypothetical protein